MCSESPCRTAVSLIYKCIDIHTKLCELTQRTRSHRQRNLTHWSSQKESSSCTMQGICVLIFTKPSPAYFSPGTLLIDAISTVEMMQISNTNTVFSFSALSFQTGNRNAFSENSPIWEPSRQARLCCHANSSKTNPSPICLSASGFGKNAFHRATDKQNKRWASQLHSLPSHLPKDSSLQARYRSRTLHCCCALSSAIAVNHRTGDYSLVYLHHIVLWNKVTGALQ